MSPLLLLPGRCIHFDSQAVGQHLTTLTNCRDIEECIHGLLIILVKFVVDSSHPIKRVRYVCVLFFMHHDIKILLLQSYRVLFGGGRAGV